MTKAQKLVVVTFYLGLVLVCVGAFMWGIVPGLIASGFSLMTIAILAAGSATL